MGVKRRVLWSVIALLLHGQAAAASPAAAASQSTSASAPASVTWPQPDGFSVALAQTGLRPSDRFRALKLLSSPPAELLVLPVQMQASGWSAAFTALIGAQLDRSLAERAVKANRQIDLFDLDGPFARRFAAAEVQAFSQRHGGLPTLAAFAGRDGDGSVFITLELRRQGQSSVAHRTLPEGKGVEDNLRAIAATFPDLLAELGLSRPLVPPPQPRPCTADTWELKGGAGDRVQVACHALAMSVLLPEFEMRSTRFYAQARSRAKLAALAHAHVEADLLLEGSGRAAKAITLALQRELARPQLEPHLNVDDPVARPLARLLWSRVRGERLPVASRQLSEQAYLQPEAARLPPFARAAYLARASSDEPWNRVDFCELEAHIAVFRASEGCTPSAGPRSSGAAEAAVLNEWRFASHYRDVEREGTLRVDGNTWKDAWKRMPADFAGHPFMRWLRFRAEGFDRAQGTYDSLISRVRLAVADATLAFAEVQRLEGRNMENWMLVSRRWTANESFMSDDEVAASERDERRLAAPLWQDGFVFGGDLQRRPSAGTGMPATAPAVSGSHRAGAAGGGPSSTFFFFNHAGPTALGMREWELKDRLRERPQDMLARVGIAMLRLKAGGSIEDARRFIDEHPLDQRVDGALGNSHDWAVAGHAFFFAGELEAARHYYRKVAGFDTGSESELIARQRLRLIDGDLRGALDATMRRLSRYESDFPRRDAAGLSFLLGRTAPAWQLLSPRLPTSSELALWAAVDVGHRQGGISLADAGKWAGDRGLDRVRVGGRSMDEWMLHRLMVLDRRPSDDELALARARWGEQGSRSATFLVSVELARLVWDDQPLAGLPRVQSLMGQTHDKASRFAAPVAWTFHRAGLAASEPALRHLDTVALTDSFDLLLGAGVHAALQGQHERSLALLRAARLELSSMGAPDSLNDELRSPPHLLGLMSHLLHKQTGESAYREEALRVARAHQRMFPYLAWPHALGALSTTDQTERTKSACRARSLDPASQFLKVAGPVPWDKCPASLW